jgi:hypothetical protein
VLVSSITLLFWLVAVGALIFCLISLWSGQEKYGFAALICFILTIALLIGFSHAFDDSHPQKAIGIYQNQVSKVFAVQYEQLHWTPLGVKTDVVFGDCYASYEDALKELESQGKPTPKPDEWVPVVEGTKGK